MNNARVTTHQDVVNLNKWRATRLSLIEHDAIAALVKQVGITKAAREVRVSPNAIDRALSGGFYDPLAFVDCFGFWPVKDDERWHTHGPETGRELLVWAQTRPMRASTVVKIRAWIGANP